MLVEEQDAPARFVGTPGMNAIVKQLQVGLDVRYEHRIERLVKDGRGWQLLNADSESFGYFDIVVLAAPAPQSIELLTPHEILTDALAGVSMAPCWTVMAHWSNPLDVPFDALELSGSIGWATRERTKPGRAERDAWVIHGSSSWSTENLELSGEVVAERFYRTFLRWLASRCRSRLPFIPIDGGTLAWNPIGVEALWDGHHRIGVCGDMCLGGRVENAYLSGRALAQSIGRGGFK